MTDLSVLDESSSIGSKKMAVLEGYSQPQSTHAVHYSRLRGMNHCSELMLAKGIVIYCHLAFTIHNTVAVTNWYSQCDDDCCNRFIAFCLLANRT